MDLSDEAEQAVAMEALASVLDMADHGPPSEPDDDGADVPYEVE